MGAVREALTSAWLPPSSPQPRLPPQPDSSLSAEAGGLPPSSTGSGAQACL